MELSLILDLFSTAAVISGIIFGLIQLRQYRLSRKREAAIYLLRSYQTTDFIEGIWLIQGLPTGLTKKQIDKRLGESTKSIGLVMSTWEALGILLHSREVTIQMVDDIFSGPILFSWQKLEKYVYDLRAELDRDTLFEWFEWLAAMMKNREKKVPPVPAHIANRDWE